VEGVRGNREVPPGNDVVGDQMIGRVAAVTDPGRTRRHNEDSYVIDPPLFAIADGMGGAQAGEVASRLATGALQESGADGRGEQRIADLIQEANRRVYERSSSDPNTSGMGTTITVALVEDDQVAFGHVGDSRAYLIRDASMEQLTEDHSLVNELLKTGKLSREEAETHPQRSVITRALGTDPDVDVDTFSVRAEIGDLFLLCSDGLTDMVSEESILAVVERNRKDIDGALRALVKEANRGGGQDNITVVAFEIAGHALSRDGDTREQARPAADDEDTLTEADAVPTVDTAVVSVDEIQAEGKSVRRRHRRRRILAWLAILLIVAAVGVLLYLRFVR
jgi:PPM family protein phosphatase